MHEVFDHKLRQEGNISLQYASSFSKSRKSFQSHTNNTKHFYTVQTTPTTDIFTWNDVKCKHPTWQKPYIKQFTEVGLTSSNKSWKHAVVQWVVPFKRLLSDRSLTWTYIYICNMNDNGQLHQELQRLHLITSFQTRSIHRQRLLMAWLLLARGWSDWDACDDNGIWLHNPNETFSQIYHMACCSRWLREVFEKFNWRNDIVGRCPQIHHQDIRKHIERNKPKTQGTKRKRINLPLNTRWAYLFW